MHFYKSEIKAWSAGGRVQFNDFVPPLGPNGGRNIIDGYQLVADGTGTTAGAALLGEDRCRIFGQIQVHERSGLQRWNLKGDQSRVMCVLLEGAHRVEEPADTGVGAGESVDCQMYIPMTKRFAKRPKDFAQPVDEFKMIELNFPALSDFSLGGSTVTTISANVWVIAHCHEESPGAVEAYMKDEVGATDFTSTTEVRISLRGKLTDLALHARGAAGGTSLANMPSVRIDDLNIPILTRLDDLLPAYKIHRGQADGIGSTQGSPMRTDPFTADMACAVLFTAEGESTAKVGKVLDSVKVTCDSNTVASLVALTRQVLPQSASYLQDVSSRHGVAASGWRFKTEGKSKREPGAWKSHERAWIPKSAAK
jgi:hypothetical protein